MHPIVALASAWGESGIGVIRLSGDGVLGITQKLFSKPERIEASPNRMLWGSFYHPQTRQLLDQGLLCYFKAPHSYTGEDCVELHLHGNPLLLHQMIEICIQLGASSAQPGEFTQRAFLNGKMDLSQVEAVMDTISAKTKTQLNQALQILNGDLKKQIDAMSGMLRDFLLQIEAHLDYPEETDPFEKQQLVDCCLKNVEQIEKLLQGADHGRLIREGVRIAILGKPNVGKSSFFNRLIQEERALVSPMAGTTRDALHEEIQWHGYLLRMIDTAGIRESSDKLEKMGIERSFKEKAKAHLVLHLVDEPPDGVESHSAEWVIMNKIDLLSQKQRSQLPESYGQISVLTGEGWEKFEQQFAQRLAKIFRPGQDQGWTINHRHQQALQEAKLFLEHLIQNQKDPLDLLSLDLRASIAALKQITGEALVQKTLDDIFSRFCLGK